jgi:hypothetical protein
MLPYLEWAGQHIGLAVIILLCWTFLIFCVLSGFFRLFQTLVGGVTPYSTEVEEEELELPDDLQDLLNEYVEVLNDGGLDMEKADAIAHRIAKRTLQYHLGDDRD